MTYELNPNSSNLFNRIKLSILLELFSKIKLTNVYATARQDVIRSNSRKVCTWQTLPNKKRQTVKL